MAITNTQTGATLPGGGAEIDSSVSLSERGPRSSDPEGFTGSFTFTFAPRIARYIDLANNTALFAGDAAGFRSNDNFIEWGADSQPTTGFDETVRWNRANPFNQIVPQFYSFVRYEQRSTGTLTRLIVFGGSITDANDLPASGVENQLARMVLQSDEPGDGSYQIAGEAYLRIDYDTGAVSGTFALQPLQGSLAQPLTVTLDGTINRANRWVRADLAGGGTGRFAGAFFGPYGAEIAASVRFVRSNGQTFYGDLVARRQ